MMGKRKWKQSKEYQRAYYHAHIEKVRAYHREWNRSHRDTIYPKQNAAKRKERRENPDKVHERERAYWRKPENAARKRLATKRWRDSPKGKAWRAAYNAKHQARVRETNRRSEARRKARKQSDAAYYAKRRADTRIRHAKARVMSGKAYRPRFHLRIPDWATMGQQIIDFASPWLWTNLTDSQRAYGRELAIERYKWRLGEK